MGGTDKEIGLIDRETGVKRIKERGTKSTGGNRR